MNKIVKYIKRPSNILLYLMNKNFFKWIPDEKYITIKYKLEMNQKLNLKEPKTFNEKLQWLKLYDRNPEYTKMVNKYEAKKYVADIIGQEYIISTLGVWDKFEDIEFDKLPKQFVLKPTHTSGNVFICKDKEKINYKQLRKMINKWLKRDYYLVHREWPYKNIKPKIIAEQYMVDDSGMKLKDYKFFCFNGIAQTILVCSNRNGSFKNTNFYDINWNLQPFTREKHKNSNEQIKKPKNLDEMITVAEKLSKDIPFVRVDLYEINGKVYFGELTFYPSSGFEGFEPEEWDKKLGDMLELPTKNISD